MSARPEVNGLVAGLLKAAGQNPSEWVVRVLDTDPKLVNAFVMGGKYGQRSPQTRHPRGHSRRPRHVGRGFQAILGGAAEATPARPRSRVHYAGRVRA